MLRGRLGDTAEALRRATAHVWEVLIQPQLHSEDPKRSPRQRGPLCREQLFQMFDLDDRNRVD